MSTDGYILRSSYTLFIYVSWYVLFAWRESGASKHPTHSMNKVRGATKQQQSPLWRDALWFVNGIFIVYRKCTLFMFKVDFKAFLTKDLRIDCVFFFHTDAIFSTTSNYIPFHSNVKLLGLAYIETWPSYSTQTYAFLLTMWTWKWYFISKENHQTHLKQKQIMLTNNENKTSRSLLLLIKLAKNNGVKNWQGVKLAWATCRDFQMSLRHGTRDDTIDKMGGGGGGNPVCTFG